MQTLTYRLAFHPLERLEIIKLRTRIYRSIGKHEGHSDMEDRFDEGALHVGVWAGNELVACARVLCRAADAEWEHDRFVTWSDALPPREQCAEISRFCIQRSHRNWRTLRMLCLGVAEAMVFTRQKYFLACCTRELIDFYRDFLRAEFTGVEFLHTDLGPKSHHLFVVPFEAGLRGDGMSFRNWLLMWPVAARMALRSGRFGVGRSPMSLWAARLKLAFLAQISPLTVSFGRKVRRTSRQGRLREGGFTAAGEGA